MKRTTRNQLYVKMKAEILEKMNGNFPDLDYGILTKEDIQNVNSYLYNIYVKERLYMNVMQSRIMLEILQREFPGFKDFYDSKVKAQDLSGYELFMKKMC